MKKTIWLLIAAISLAFGFIYRPTPKPSAKSSSACRSRRPTSSIFRRTSPRRWDFCDMNIDVELVTFEGGTQTLRGSVAGGLDITGTSSDPAIIAAARGAGTKVLGTYSHKLSQSMLVQGDIKSCKDLKGRKIGIQEVGAFNEVMSRAVLASCGLTPKDVRIRAGEHQRPRGGTVERPDRHGDSTCRSGDRRQEEKGGSEYSGQSLGATAEMALRRLHCARERDRQATASFTSTS